MATRVLTPFPPRFHHVPVSYGYCKPLIYRCVENVVWNLWCVDLSGETKLTQPGDSNEFPFNWDLPAVKHQAWPKMWTFDDWSGQRVHNISPTTRFPEIAGDVPSKTLPFGVRSCEVAIIWPDWWLLEKIICSHGISWDFCKLFSTNPHEPRTKKNGLTFHEILIGS